jgi:hypothetical protein
MLFLDKDRMMDNVQQHNICTYIPPSQTLDLILVYSFKLPDYNNSAGYQYSATYNGPRRKFPQNFMQKSLKKRNVYQKPKNHSMENGNSSENCEEPRQNGEQSANESEVPEHEEPLNNEKVNGHSEHGSDVTNGKGGTKRDTTVSKANVEHPGNEDDLKNSDNSDQISQKSHTNNGELLYFVFTVKCHFTFPALMKPYF